MIFLFWVIENCESALLEKVNNIDLHSFLFMNVDLNSSITRFGTFRLLARCVHVGGDYAPSMHYLTLLILDRVAVELEPVPAGIRQGQSKPWIGVFYVGPTDT